MNGFFELRCKASLCSYKWIVFSIRITVYYSWFLPVYMCKAIGIDRPLVVQITSTLTGRCVTALKLWVSCVTCEWCKELLWVHLALSYLTLNYFVTNCRHSKLYQYAQVLMQLLFFFVECFSLISCFHFVALINSWVALALCFGSLSICIMKRYPIWLYFDCQTVCLWTPEDSFGCFCLVSHHQ